MSSFDFDGYEEFETWCVENGYDPDEHYDLEEESYKRDVNLTFYVKNEEKDVYALVVVSTNYDWGWGCGEVLSVNLKRVEKQVTTTQVSYE